MSRAVLTTSLYAHVLGAEAWGRLPAPLRAMHEKPISARGRFRIRNARGRAGRWLAFLFRLPDEADDVPIHLQVACSADTETWTRTLGSRRLVTTQHATASGLLAERAGLVAFHFRLEADELGITFHQVAARLCLGPVRVPMPGWLMPRVCAREAWSDDDNSVRVLVQMRMPLVGQLLEYGGLIAREGETP